MDEWTNRAFHRDVNIRFCEKGKLSGRPFNIGQSLKKFFFLLGFPLFPLLKVKEVWSLRVHKQSTKDMPITIRQRDKNALIPRSIWTFSNFFCHETEGRREKRKRKAEGENLTKKKKKNH